MYAYADDAKQPAKRACADSTVRQRKLGEESLAGFRGVRNGMVSQRQRWGLGRKGALSSRVVQREIIDYSKTRLGHKQLRKELRETHHLTDREVECVMMLHEQKRRYKIETAAEKARKKAFPEDVSVDGDDADSMSYLVLLNRMAGDKEPKDMTLEEIHTELVDDEEYIPGDPFRDFFTEETTESSKAIGFRKRRFDKAKGPRDKMLTPKEHFNFQTYTFGLAERAKMIHLYRSLDQKALKKLKATYGEENFLDISTYTPQFSRGFIAGGIHSNKMFQIHEQLTKNSAFLGRAKETKKNPESTAVLGREMLSLFEAGYKPKNKGGEFFMEPPRTEKTGEQLIPNYKDMLRDRKKLPSKVAPMTKAKRQKIEDDYTKSLSHGMPEDKLPVFTNRDVEPDEELKGKHALDMVTSMATIWNMDTPNPSIDYKGKSLFATAPEKKRKDETSLSNIFAGLSKSKK